MKEYFISEINIEKLYHLSNITIELDTTKRQHLLLTGKNGSGKNRITDNGRIGFVSIAMALGLHGMIMMDLKVRIKKENL